MRILALVGGLIALLILGKIFLWNKEEAKPTAGPNAGPAKAMPVKTIVLQNGSSTQNVYSSGSLAPNEEVELRCELSGKITNLYISEGSFVNKGQLIAKIKDDDIKAQLKKVSLEAELATQTEARQKKLLDIEAISKEEYDIASNKVSTLNADSELLKIQLARTEIRAPFSGRIGLKNISVGAYVTPATMIATLVQTNPLKVDFSIPEKYLTKIHNGQTIGFQIDGSNVNYNAKIIAVDPQIDASLRTVNIRAITQNNDNKLLPGMFVKVSLNLGSDASIMIPSETIIPVLEGKMVYLKKNGVVTKTIIETGLRNESDVQVLSGLQPGDSLITSSLMTLKAGAPVTAKK